MKKHNFFVQILFLVLIISFFSNAVFAAPSLSLIYVIQQGDTLSEIAAEYKIELQTLKKENSISNKANIKMGDELVIPISVKQKQDTNSRRLFANYKSKENELCFAINTHYAVRINPGKQSPNIENIPEDKIINYYVGSGDTLYDLARDFSTSIGTILALNNKENSFLQKGEKLRLPVHNLTDHQILNKRVSKQELNLLARAVHGEARGEPYMGQVAVAAVIINRVLSYQFPNTFAQVIYQGGQFSAVSDGQINLRPNQTAYKAARAALNGSDPTNGALYFYNPKTATRVSFFKGRRVITQIGNHLFIE